jgi:hypothetical protein
MCSYPEPWRIERDGRLGVGAKGNAQSSVLRFRQVKTIRPAATDGRPGSRVVMDYCLLAARNNALERPLYNRTVATVIEFNVDHPQSRDRDAGCENLLHGQYPSSQYDEDAGFVATRNLQSGCKRDNPPVPVKEPALCAKVNSIKH